ncbi:MAG: hypothetical protein IJC82_04700, partial [Firmicutes bacterium]|nr:hypothetical protein [Bacillota bacterium]
MSEFENEKEVYKGEIVDVESRKPLTIFKTDEDKYGCDIAQMSDFFDGYVQQMSLAIREQSDLEVLTELPMANLGIISDVVHQAEIIMQGNMTLLPDFDNLPPDIKTKLKKGIYTVGESKQVDGNLRAVILDEEGVRVKDITLKKVLNNSGNIETVRNIGNQMQMRQIYTKLADIQEIQSYQLEKDRDRDIVVPFLDARSLVLEAETKTNEEERIALLKEADGKIRTALNSVYADIETTSKRFAKRTSIPLWVPGGQIDTYMGFLTTDLQIATKYVGVRMQLLEYMGEKDTAKSVLQNYQHVVYDFLTKPVTRNGLSTATLMHDYFPYDK